jgi:charged multivesicular body protein 4
MDEINDNMENMRQIQDLLSAPMGAAADFDEVSLSLPTYLWAHMRVFA